MSEVSFILAAALWGVLPGWALLAALDLGESRVERLAAAVGLSMAFVAASAYAAELVGLPVAPGPVALLAGVMCLAARMLRRTGRSASPAGQTTAGGPQAAAWLVFALPVIVAVQLHGAMSFLLLPPTMHDGLDHANWFRLIYELRSLDPAVLLAPPLGPDGGPTYYPFGMHAFLALVAQSTSVEPHVVLMRGLIGISAALPLSVFAFVAWITGRTGPALGAALGSLVFWWLPYQTWAWGGFALMAGAAAALPVARLALSAVARVSPVAMAAAVWCGMGLVVLHPSQAWAALLIATLVSLTQAASRGAPWVSAAPFAIGFAGASLALAFGPSLWAPIGDFMDKADIVGAAFAAAPGAAGPVDFYFRAGDLFPIASRVALAALYLAGAVQALRRRILWPFVVLHAAGYLLLVLAPSRTWVTSLWYHSPERIWYLQYASLPAFAGLGLAALVGAVNRAARRWNAYHWRLVLWPAAAWFAIAAVYRPHATAASRELWLYAHQNPQLTFGDDRALADFAWIRAHVPREEVLFNAPADWGLPLPFTGRRTVFWSGGYAVDPTVDWNGLLSMLRAGDPHTAQAAAELGRLGVRRVYAGRLDSRLQVGGRLPLDAAVLVRSEGLERVYESPTATILAVREYPVEWLGVRDSARIEYHNFTPLQVEHGREWRWTAELGRIRIHRPGLAGQACYLRVLGSPIDTYDVELDGQILLRTSLGFELPPAYDDREFFDLRVRRSERDSFGLAPDAPKPEGVRITDLGFHCADSPPGSV